MVVTNQVSVRVSTFLKMSFFYMRILLYASQQQCYATVKYGSNYSITILYIIRQFLVPTHSSTQ